MNPFDWRGPQFLLFYLALIVAVLAWCWRRVRGGADTTTVPRVSDLINDPYFIAYLRGGTSETIRIAVFNLLDRGFLAFEKKKLVAKRSDIELLRRPIDRALLQTCATPRTLLQLVSDVVVQLNCRDYGDELRRRSFLIDDAQRLARRSTVFIGISVLLGVAAVKIALAVHRGHFNLTFLMMPAVVAVYAVIIVCGVKQRTPLGQRALSQLRELTSRLRQRAAELRPGGASTDALLLAGVFGVGALPTEAFPLLTKIYPHANINVGGNSGRDSCGSSCGGGGGSCGGGCGGGCGGCGS